MNQAKPRGTRPGGFHLTGPGGLDAAGFAGWYKGHSLAQWEALDLNAVARLADLVVSTRAKGKRIWTMGNGGSAATASHIAADFSKTAAVPGRAPVQCVSLSDNVAYLTAIGNDLSFDSIFSRQLENFLGRGDLVLLVSGSGNSPNLIKAARLAKTRGATTASLLGFDGGKLKAISDLVVLVPSEQYGVIEDIHMAIGHIITFYLKQMPD